MNRPRNAGFLPMTQYLQQLGDISVADFLRDYWQKKPLLIRQAFPAFKSPLSADEIAGLSLEDEIESRLILENHQGSPWQLRCGPFDEEAYQQLPEKNWTLLVQALDHYIPEVGELLKSFRFIPSWRLDDVMVSYAVDGGSVGPHYDHYDVFLLQGQGQRHWQLGQLCDENSKTLNNTALNILQDFDPQQDWLLEPGDMLYLPPKFAHWGVAKGECITYSIGFRAPSAAKLVDEHSHNIGAALSDFQRYQDSQLEIRENFAEILPADIERVQSLLNQHLDANRHGLSIAKWFGENMTENKYPGEDFDKSAINCDFSQLRLEKNPASRLAFFATSRSSALLFVDGESFATDLEFAQAFSQADFWQCSTGDDQDIIQHCLENNIFWRPQE